MNTNMWRLYVKKRKKRFEIQEPVSDTPYMTAKIKDIKEFYNNYSPNVSELVAVGNITKDELP